MLLNRFLIMLALPLLALQADVADAQKKGLLPERPTASEFRSLPPYCHARMQGDAATRKSWEQQIGREIFMHLHHYCVGMNFMNRARLEMDNQKKRYYLQMASNNFGYVISRWPPGNSLTINARSYKQQADSMNRKK